MNWLISQFCAIAVGLAGVVLFSGCECDFQTSLTRERKAELAAYTRTNTVPKVTPRLVVTAAVVATTAGCVTVTNLVRHTTSLFCYRAVTNLTLAFPMQLRVKPGGVYFEEPTLVAAAGPAAAWHLATNVVPHTNATANGAPPNVEWCYKSSNTCFVTVDITGKPAEYYRLVYQ